MNSKIKNLNCYFTFIGQPFINKKEGSKFYTTSTSESGYINSKIQFGIKSSENNLVFVELGGGYNPNTPPTIKASDNDRNRIEVAWKDRFNSEVLKTVSNMNCVRINLDGDNENEGEKFLITMFSSCYDAVEYLKDKLTDEKRLYVSGKVEFNRYEDRNGKMQMSIKYIPSVIRLAKEDEENKAEANMSFTFDKESWDESSLKEDGKVMINGYVTAYDKNVKGNVFLNNMFVLDFSKTDLTTDLGRGMFEYYKKLFNVKKDEYWETVWHCKVLRGFETEEITMDTLSLDQKMQIQLGITTFEELKRDMRKSVVKNKVNEIQLVRPINKFEGVPTSLTVYEEDDFLMPVADEKIEQLGTVEKVDDLTNSVLNSLFPQQG